MLLNNVGLPHESCLASSRPSVGKTERNNQHDRYFGVEIMLEITSGAIVAREAWVGSGHYAIDPKTPSYFFRSSATTLRLSITLRFTGRTLGAG